MDIKEQNIYQVLENNKQEESEQKIELANEEIVQENKGIPVKKFDRWKIFSLVTICAYFCLFVFLLAGITTFNKKSLNIVNSILLIIDFFSITSSTILEHILQLCACGLYYFTIGYSIKVLIKMIKMLINGAKNKEFDFLKTKQTLGLGLIFIVTHIMSTLLLGGQLNALTWITIVFSFGMHIAVEAAWFIRYCDAGDKEKKNLVIKEGVKCTIIAVCLCVITVLLGKYTLKNFIENCIFIVQSWKIIANMDNIMITLQVVIINFATYLVMITILMVLLFKAMTSYLHGREKADWRFYEHERKKKIGYKAMMIISIAIVCAVLLVNIISMLVYKIWFIAGELLWESIRHYCLPMLICSIVLHFVNKDREDNYKLIKQYYTESVGAGIQTTKPKKYT